jgi:hypothetical protein
MSSGSRGRFGSSSRRRIHTRKTGLSPIICPWNLGPSCCTTALSRRSARAGWASSGRRRTRP